MGMAAVISPDDGRTAACDRLFGAYPQFRSIQKCSWIGVPVRIERRTSPASCGEGFLSREFWLTVSWTSDQTERVSRLSKAGWITVISSAYRCSRCANTWKVSRRKEPYRNTCRVGREPQHIKVLAGLQIFAHPAAGLTFGKVLQCFAQVVFGKTMVFRDAEHGHHAEEE